jgi:hypothetical protein
MTPGRREPCHAHLVIPAKSEIQFGRPKRALLMVRQAHHEAVELAARQGWIPAVAGMTK